MTDHFDYLCIENDIDQLWNQCKDRATFHFDIDITQTFSFFLMELLEIGKEKFLEILSKILVDFAERSDEDKDFSKIGDALLELGYTKSIIEKLELIPEKVTDSVPQKRYGPEISDTIFIVHGHDDEAKISVARFIEKLGLKAVILHEQPNAGQTIIEKFERHASTSGYAVIILTPDDIGASKDSPDDVKARARQNVILELGYFCGALSRSRVSVLVKEGVEIPSDYLGVIYTPMDSNGGWQIQLVKEIKSAGLQFDANKVF